MKEKVNRMLRENQCGFRQGRGCADQLFSLRMLMERAREFHQPLFICFVDMKKVYDSVNRIPRRLLVCKFAGDKRAVGGQKLRWVDVVMRDLKKCKLDHKWMHVAQDRDKWSFIVETAVTELNEEAEEMEKMKKDKRKERRERKQLADQTDLLCNHPGCSFTAHNKAGLVNHQRQKHGAAAQKFLTCQHCQRNFCLQGFNNHVKFCHLNPNRTKRSNWGKLSPK